MPPTRKQFARIRTNAVKVFFWFGLKIIINANFILQADDLDQIEMEFVKKS